MTPYGPQSQQGYGQPGYPPQGYAPHGYGAPPPRPPKRTDPRLVAGLVGGGVLVCAVLIALLSSAASKRRASCEVALRELNAKVTEGNATASRAAMQEARKTCTSSRYEDELDALERMVTVQEEQAKTLAARPALLAAGFAPEQLSRETMLPICKEKDRMPVQKVARTVPDAPRYWDCDEKVLYQEQPQTHATCEARRLDFTSFVDENGKLIGACKMSDELIEEDRLRKACKVEPTARIHTAEDGWVMATCQTAIKKVLKSPATAEFPGMFDEDGKPSSADGCTKVYASYVDAQNAFGAKLRTHYVCTYDPRTGSVTTKLR